MRSPSALLALALAGLAGPLGACSGGTAREPVPRWDGTAPPATCAPPALLADVSAPAAVVGAGTPGSCTAAALQAAADGGGVIVFDCGPAPVTIPISSTIVFRREAVLDGGGKVTLSGEGKARILLLDSGYDVPTPRLTVQRLVFQDGRSARGADDTASGGAAIYRDGGSLTVVDCAFLGNHAPSTGPDLAGGAIYAFGGGDTVVVGSTFIGNSASDGGAIGSLNGDLVIANSTFSGNEARGSGGNPGDGGCGGALYQDGRDERTELCGVTIRGNAAGAIGGGVFRVSNDGTGRFTMDRSTVDANVVTPATSGNAGGLYLQGLAISATASTVSRNRAFYNGGLWINAGTAELTNVTIAENVATGSNGGGLWLGHGPTGALVNCTIANNRAIARDQIAGAIFGAGLELRNTLVAGNTAMWVPACDEEHPDGGGNLQFPGAAPCTSGIAVADPLLGPLGDGGGPTETMTPAPGSPALRRGTGCPATDQRGQPRAEPCTAGAVEAR
jgi:hypothetical protein